ncbi:TraV family lipoprotein [Desulfopila sp. IMCC35008]|uniref:TraV family lipoprotein n=1 Tax=Desulfopila sp. IMCC35008 TaxID=2653858 RepID=UPI002714F497|nr:TraV family lipoprotein [Desulfopila sp. IMCC35008]
MLNPYNEDFKCRAKDDAGECIDTPTAYQKARYPKTEAAVIPDPAETAQKELQENRYKIVSELLKEETKPLLQPPKILRVLLLPYKGEDEELFMSRYVYLKIEDSQWVLTDLEEQ